MASKKAVVLTKIEIGALGSAIAALADAQNEVEFDLKQVLLTQAAIETKQEAILLHLQNLAGTVRGDKGLVVQQALLNQRISALELHNDNEKAQKNVDVANKTASKGVTTAQLTAILSAVALAVAIFFQTPGCRRLLLVPPPTTTSAPK